MEEFFAGAFVVRSRNPDEDGENFRTGRAARRYDPTESWFQFLWFGLRDGLMEAVKGVGWRLRLVSSRGSFH